MITTLHSPEAATEGTRVVHQVQVTFAPGTIPDGAIRTEISGPEAMPLASSVVPAVPGVYVLACRLGQDLRTDEPLPPALHLGARHVGSLLHDWYGWRPAELIAPLAAEPLRPNHRPWRPRRGLFFTRGVDSWATLLELQQGPRRMRPTHLITVDNEVHIDQQIRAETMADTQATADRLGLPLIKVATDVRALLDPHTDWGWETHGSVLAGIGLALRGTLDEVVISPTHWTPMLRPWGSHPELDPCWSVPGLQVIHHPGSTPRWRRVERIAADPRAAAELMVCWQGTSRRNCGRCEKCLRLMTSLRLLGAEEVAAPAFEVPFDPERIQPHLTVSPEPWADTIDHLDAVGAPADELRQRWEQVQAVGNPAVSYDTRPIWPRVPLMAEGGHPAPGGPTFDAVVAHLTRLGFRVDHLAEPAGPGDLAVWISGEGPTVRLAVGTPEAIGAFVPLAGITALDLRPFAGDDTRRPR